MARLALLLLLLCLAASPSHSYPLLVYSGPQLYQDSELTGSEALTGPQILTLNQAIEDYDGNAVGGVLEPQVKPEPYSFRIPKYLKMMSRTRKSDGACFWKYCV